MKRIAWLLLAISLPAWATINGVDSSRILIPCNEGQRSGEYPDGGACNPPAPYTQDWLGFSLSSTAHSAINGDANLRIFSHSKGPSEDVNAYQIVSSQCRDGDSRALFMRNVGTIKDSVGKHRQEIQFADNLPDFDRTSDDTEYWFGYSKYIPSAGWPKASEAGGGSLEIISNQFKNGQGPNLLFQYQHDGNSDGLIRLTFIRYWGATEGAETPVKYYYKKKSGATENTNTTSNTVSEFPLDRWMDIIVRFVQDPDGSTGSVTVYVVDTSDSTITTMVNETNVQIGYADEAGVGIQFEDGMYWGPTDRSFTYQMYYDAYHAYKGTDGYNIVKPDGTPCGA